MICSNCQTENDEGRKFCLECASPLVVTCPNCGTANSPRAKFCGECATALQATAGTTAATAAAAERQAAGERRLVSVLFADLVGFTTYSEERDPEDVRAMLSRWYELASEVIGRYGGVVEKFIGDAVMAVWGTPVAHEDDAERAVRAGLEVVDAVRELGDGIEARAGVLTGEAAVTRDAVNQGLVVGDMVNTAARLQSVALPGTVLVGEATYRAASRAVAFEQVGEQDLKGKATPVPAWQALRVISERGGRNRSEALEPPFVGRQDEFRLVKDLFHATGRERRLRLVSVMGPAGIGKSRLARELTKYCDGLVEDVYYHSGRCPSYGEAISFWALGEMVRARCGLREADDEATTRQKVAETAARWIADEEERHWIEPALLTLLGIDADSASDQLFAAWRTFFERIASEGTVVLVFEDFHLADTGLIDFVQHLLEWSRGLPIYVITLSRPELLEKRPEWGAGQRNFVSLVLEPLPEAAMGELLLGLVPGLPEATVGHIVARADGIPLYAVEMVRMLLSKGALQETDGAYVLVGDPDALSVPETLVALIGSRLDSLDDTDRTLLQDAAVLGQSFTVKALASVSGVEESGLEPRLQSLARRELLVREGDPRSPEQGQFAFVQSLVREVVYSTLAKRERKVRHVATARYFESLGTDEVAGALAGHYLAAHANATDDVELNALGAQARITLRAAAERAVNLGAYDHAATFLQQALTVTTDPGEQADLLERAGDAVKISGRLSQAEALLRRALALRRETGDRRGAARATAALAECLLEMVDRNPEAFELLEGASVEFADLAPDPVLAMFDAHLARAYVSNDDPARAYEVAERALQNAEQRGLQKILANALISKGASLGAMGRKREGIALLKEAERVAREHGFHQELLGALLLTAFETNDLDQAAALAGYREGLELARRLGHRNVERRFANNIGYTAFLAGEWDEAARVLEEAVGEATEAIDRIGMLSNLSVLHAARGQPIDGEVAEIERVGSEIADPRWRAVIFDAEGNAALATGRLDASRAAWLALTELEPYQIPEFRYRAARCSLWSGDVASVKDDLAAILATGVHGTITEVRIATLEAGIAALEGRMSEATAMYREALQVWQDVKQPWDEALTVIDMATVLATTDPELQRAIERARQFFTRVGAPTFLERLEAAIGRAEPSHRSDDIPLDSPAVAVEREETAAGS